MDIHLLAGTRLFHGIREHEIEAMLTCLSACLLYTSDAADE